MATPQTDSKKISVIAFAIIALLVVGTLGYYFWAQSGSNSSNPPFLHVPKQTFKGQLISGDVICQIPGLYSFSSSEVANYTKPAETTDADAKTLAEGIHIYHANQDLTVSAILKSIKPTEGNKIMIAYYPSNGNGDTNFAVYPADLLGEKKIITPDNFKIPANEGFVIFSCQNTTVYKILDEKTNGTWLPTNFGKADNGTHWVLFSGWKDGVNTSTIKAALTPYNIKSVWVQNNDGFSFQQSDVNNIAVNGNYRMIWAEIYANPIKSAKDPQQTICEAQPSCTTHTCISFWGGYTCNMSTTGTGSSGVTGVDPCNTTGGYFNSTGCAAKSGTPYPATAVSSGKVDMCNISGGSYSFSGCLGQKATSGSTLGVSELCNTTGANFNSTGCFVSGGTPYPPVKSSLPTYTGTDPYFMVSFCNTQCVYSNYTCKQPPSNENWYCIKNGTSFPASLSPATPTVSNGVIKITAIKSDWKLSSQGFVEVGFDFSLTGTLSPFDKVTWDFGDGVSNNIRYKDWFWGNDLLPTNTTYHNYTKSGNYTVTVKAVSSAGTVITTASTNLPFSMPNTSPIKITKCHYDNTNNLAGFIDWSISGANTNYTYKLNYTLDNNVKKTITIYPISDTTHSYVDNNYAPFAKITDVNEADLYNLSYGNNVTELSITPIDSNGNTLTESDSCLIQ